MLDKNQVLRKSIINLKKKKQIQLINSKINKIVHKINLKIKIKIKILPIILHHLNNSSSSSSNNKDQGNKFISFKI